MHMLICFSLEVVLVSARFIALADGLWRYSPSAWLDIFRLVVKYGW